MSHPSLFSWSCLSAAVLTLTFATVACDPADDLDLDDEALEADEDDDALPVEAEFVAPPPTTAEDAGKDRVAARDLTAPVEAAAGWIAAVSEETPPATCDSDEAMYGSDCTGSHCDWVQLFCAPHGGTAGDRSWTDWFSEEGTSWRICPGTEYVTGIACQGPWCDDISIECTDLGLFATSCQWSSWFRSEDPLFFANPGELVGGVQCKGAYCEEMRFFRCAV